MHLFKPAVLIAQYTETTVLIAYYIYIYISHSASDQSVTLLLMYAKTNKNAYPSLFPLHLSPLSLLTEMGFCVCVCLCA